MEIYIPKPFIYGFVALNFFLFGLVTGCSEGMALVYSKARANNCLCVEHLKGE